MAEDQDGKKEPVCFVIMPISDVHGYEPGHFGRVYEHVLKPAITQAGYRAIRADDTTKTDYIVVGIIQHIVEADMILCDFSAKNPNVMYELGIRHAFNKPVTLVKDRKTEKVFDIQGLRYTEYEDSLRVDSVQKDIEKISKSLKETASSGAGDVNSVIQLAGIKPADIPAGRTVSADTQILMSAIASLERRIGVPDDRSKGGLTFFQADGEKVTFTDDSNGLIGDFVTDSEGKHVGTIVDIHPADNKIFIRLSDGKVIPFSGYSIKARGLTAEIPF